MKRTSLTDKHIELGAKMVEFAGYNMPVYYNGIKEEHNTVREGVGVFDVSHMGEFTVKGPDALNFLQYVTSNDVAKLIPGKVQYSCFPNDQGGIVDDLLVYMMGENDYYLVVNAANIDKDWNWVNKQAEKFNVELKNISDDVSQIAVQGPAAFDAIQSLTDVNLKEMEYYTFHKTSFAGFDDILVSTTGYTGSGGVEIYSSNDQMPEIWDKVFEAGKEYDIKPIGLGARDTLRLEVGFCLYGNDIDDTTSPIEAGLGWITKFNKDFIMKEHHLKIKEEGASKRLAGMELLERGIPRQHCEIVNENDEVIGEVTSGTQAPYINKAIAMGYINRPYFKSGTEVYIKIRNKKIKAQVVKIPFYKK
jgi:aminomethyltransferase